MIVLSIEAKVSWSISDSFREALLCSPSKVAKIFFLTLNDVFSKCGSSVASGKESANFLNVSIDTIRKSFLGVSDAQNKQKPSVFEIFCRSIGRPSLIYTNPNLKSQVKNIKSKIPPSAKI